MRFLVVAPDYPYPPNHGGRVDVWTRLKALATVGDVDLIASVKDMPTQEELAPVRRYVSNLRILKRDLGLKSLFKMRPYQVESRGNLEYVAPPRQYDAVFLEGEYVGAICENPSLKSTKFYLRIHNDEPAFFRDLGKSASFPAKIYYFTESFKFRSYCRRLHEKMAALLYISKSEFLGSPYRDMNRTPSALWLPAGIEVSAMVRKDFKKWMAGRNRHVLCVSSLFMPNNLWGVEWYLKSVHPVLKNAFEDYKVVIAGNTGGKKMEELIKSRDGQFIDLIPNPSDLQLKRLYSECMVFASPIFHGAGVKLKNLNAILEGIPVVTTTLGAEGSGLVHEKHVIIADEASGFAEAILKYLKNPAKAFGLLEEAQSFLQNNYDPVRNLNQLLS